MTADVAAAPATPARPAWRPSPRDWQYVEALKHWLTLPAHQATRAKLAELAGLHKGALSLFERHPRRQGWLRDQLGDQGRRDGQWEQIVDRAYWRALAGDVQWAIFFAKATGRFTLSDAVRPEHEPGGPLLVQVHIPRPELMPAPAEARALDPVGLVTTDVLDLTRRR